MKPARFKYYQSGIDEIPDTAMYDMNGSDVSAETLKLNGVEVPKTPNFDDWLKLVRSKQKCGRCWKQMRGAADLMNHTQTVHLTQRVYIP
jgi:hypothetical protein